MKPVRVIILAVAVASAGLAGLLALKLTSGKTVISTAEPVIEREPTVNVLVASKGLPVGSRLSPDSVHWLSWPKDGVVEGLITEELRPNAVTDLQGVVVRLPMFNGEPVRQEKIADSSSRIMSSLLPAGKRAVATEITVATGAGGFILPNDRVDVIMVRKNDENFLTETVLSNVRVPRHRPAGRGEGRRNQVRGWNDRHVGTDTGSIQGHDGCPADGRAPVAGAAQRRGCPGAGHDRRRSSLER